MTDISTALLALVKAMQAEKIQEDMTLKWKDSQITDAEITDAEITKGQKRDAWLATKVKKYEIEIEMKIKEESKS